MILTLLYEMGDKTIITGGPARALHPQLQKKSVIRYLEILQQMKTQHSY